MTRCNNKKWIKKLLLFLVGLLVALVAAFGVYISIYYHADAAALQAVQTPPSGVTVTQQQDGSLIFSPQNPQAGLVFYPGGKVEHTAYAPLMAQLAGQGVQCVLIKMPGNLAFFNIDAADGYVDDALPWYIGGHSLGGVAATVYAKDHADSLQGIVFLASYPSGDLSDTNLRALSVLASNDRVLSRSAYEDSTLNRPADFTQVEIAGGCHGGFGSYGAQKGDGVPTISAAEQWRQTAQAMAAFMGVEP